MTDPDKDEMLLAIKMNLANILNLISGESVVTLIIHDENTKEKLVLTSGNGLVGPAAAIQAALEEEDIKPVLH
tara:strand:- start:8143 stop:8361 length:219 start_codon:yes stop_codon:yes gene_type:complete